MPLLDELLPASYKRVPFFVSSSSISGGRKDQVHEFPNSDKQTVEDFGLSPRSYSVVAWISGDNYKSKRDALLRALEEGGPGVLSHPFDGEVQNVVARTFTLEEKMEELGRAEISIKFVIDGSPGLPKKTENTLGAINLKNNILQKAANGEIKNNWKVNESFMGNFSSAQSKLSSLKDKYNSASVVIVNITDSINEFNSAVSDFSSDVNSLIKDPSRLADSITNVSLGMNALHATGSSQVIAWRGMFSFGDDDQSFQATTTGLAQRKRNNSALNSSLQSQALGYAYLASANSVYSTVDEVEVIAGILEDQYKKITSASIGQELRDSLGDLRDITSLYFSDLRITLNRIATVYTQELPARVISFQYYNDSSIGEEIATLNNEANVSFLSGNIQVVTE